VHITPEAAVGGPLACVRSGDRIRLSVARRELRLLVTNEELAARAAQVPPRKLVPKERGYRKLFLTTVTQADQGCDFDFLRAAEFSGSVPRSPP
jgi:dihydroxy-acid dehydratase